jgi:hypothetical protein
MTRGGDGGYRIVNFVKYGQDCVLKVIGFLKFYEKVKNLTIFMSTLAFYKRNS